MHIEGLKNINAKRFKDFEYTSKRSFQDFLTDEIVFDELKIKNKIDDSYIQFMVLKQCKGLSINAKEAYTIDFLTQLPWLEGIEINFNVKGNIKALYSCTKLKYISIHSKESLDFSHFPDLRICNVSIKKGNLSLYQCINLEFAKISYREDDCYPLGKLVNLRYLELNYNKLKSLNGIETLIKLERLDIENAQIKEIPIEFSKLTKQASQLAPPVTNRIRK